ncbi:MAG TPA: S1-like domain-containing RNA-binding protein [Agitococcus sp.]|nr:S1-like domain-containing RNA-binding protein [Agitococcus sp.]
MVNIGQVNRLEVVEQLKQHYLLEGGRYGDIPIAKQDVPQGTKVGQSIDAFVFIDEEGYLAASSQQSVAQVGQFASLKVLSVTPEGAWLDWGIEPSLFLPRKEQQQPVERDRYCLVRLCFEERKGIYATTYLNNFLQNECTEFKQGDKVSILIASPTELGFRVIVNHRYWGALYANEVFQQVYKGQILEAYVKRLREDKRLDLSLQPLGFAKVTGITDDILQRLKQQKGYLMLSDKSSPDEIYAAFGVSKKVFKQAIGTLFKQRQIIIEEQGIRLANRKI